MTIYQTPNTPWAATTLTAFCSSGVAHCRWWWWSLISFRAPDTNCTYTHTSQCRNIIIQYTVPLCPFEHLNIRGLVYVRFIVSVCGFCAPNQIVIAPLFRPYLVSSALVSDMDQLMPPIRITWLQSAPSLEIHGWHLKFNCFDTGSKSNSLSFICSPCEYMIIGWTEALFVCFSYLCYCL